MTSVPNDQTNGMSRRAVLQQMGTGLGMLGLAHVLQQAGVSAAASPQDSG